MKTYEQVAETWYKVLATFAMRAGIPLRIEEVVRGPQLCTVKAQTVPASVEKLCSTGMRRQIEHALDVENVEVEQRGRTTCIYIPLPMDMRLPVCVADLDHPKKSAGVWVAIGQMPDGKQVNLNVGGDTVPHGLIAGRTGSGKSFLERVLAYQLAAHYAPDQVRLILIDAKGGAEWRGFDRAAHLENEIIGEPHTGMKALAWASAQVEVRKETAQRSPEIFVIIDEIAELIDVGGQDVAAAVDHISRLGRGLGLHIFVATQRPVSDGVGGSVAKSQLGLRACGAVNSAQDSYIVTQLPGIGGEYLQGRGDFKIVAGQVVVRVQVAYPSRLAIKALPRAETVPATDFGDFDVRRVVGGQVPPSPDHLAVAVATGWSLNKLARLLHLGRGVNGRAVRLHEEAVRLRASFERFGIQIVPPPDGVIEARLAAEMA